MSEARIKALKEALKEAGVKYHPRHGLEKLEEIAAANSITVASKVIKGSVVPAHYKKDYGPTQSCNDEVANFMKEAATDDKGKADLAALKKIAADNGVDFGKWEHLNIGMARMNLSNVLRGKLKRNEQVTIGRHKLGKAA